jgi:triacylglycerol lipase
VLAGFALVIAGAAVTWAPIVDAPVTESPTAHADPSRDVGSTGEAESLGAGQTGMETTPRRAATVPVLLVPGWLDTGRELAALRIRLLTAGWPATHVEAITFAEPTGSNRSHAEELDSAVNALLQQSGAERVDIVAHSMGGLATRWYLLTRPDAPVRRAVFIASPHRGTLSAHLAWGGGRDEMMPDSPFLDSLNSAAPVPQRVEVITIRTSVDTHVVPGESATLPGVADHRLCCPTHAGLLRDDLVFDIVLGFLEDGPSSE